MPQRSHAKKFLAKEEMGELVATLQKEGYTVLGPCLTGGVISLRPIRSADELARGLEDAQEPGSYRTGPGDPDFYFRNTPGADGPKRFLFPPTQTLFGLHIEGRRFVVDSGPPDPPKLAFLGVRPCELAAIAVMDCCFGAHDPGTFRCETNPYYAQARQTALMLAVNCIRPGGNCFCTSMNTGPVAKERFDLSLTELRGGFVIEIGSPRGEELMQRLNVREPSAAELELAELRLEQACKEIRRHVDREGLSESLENSIESHRWDEVAKRCLGCGNCTMVCPTCICSSIVDSNQLNGPTATRTRMWESCFTHQFTYTTSGPVRHTIRARYRHWLLHKLTNYEKQYGASGCVGCGRCITWCPVGIDITEEVAAIHGESIAQAGVPQPKGAIA
jgi:sulfhydrogenase subunit beta (sulfur reductase)